MRRSRWCTTSNRECSHGAQWRVDPKRPVNLMINEALVAQAKGYINNLSAMAQEGQTIADALDELLTRSWG